MFWLLLASGLAALLFLGLTQNGALKPTSLPRLALLAVPLTFVRSSMALAAQQNDPKGTLDRIIVHGRALYAWSLEIGRP
jgi:hypothetical protein